MRLPGLVLFIAAFGATAASAQTPQEAESIYKTRCATCHETGVPRAPNREALRRLTPETIAAALATGSMRAQGQELTLAQIQLLARTLGNAPPTTAATVPASTTCSANEPSAPVNPLGQPNWNGWGVNLAQHRFQPAAMARLSASDVPRLKLKWAFGFPGVTRAFAQPTVVGGRIFVGSANSVIYSLNANSGCQVLDVQGRQPRPHGDHHRAGQRTREMDRLLWRSTGDRLRRGRTDRRTGVEAPGGELLGLHDHRRANAG